MWKTALKKFEFKFFKGCLPQILLGPFLNTLTQIWIDLQLVLCINTITVHVVLKKTIAFFNKFTSTFLKSLCLRSYLYFVEACFMDHNIMKALFKLQALTALFKLQALTATSFTTQFDIIWCVNITIKSTESQWQPTAMTKDTPQSICTFSITWKKIFALRDSINEHV